MKRRNTKIKDFVTNPGSKVISARFGNQSKSVIVSGDDKNNINLWKITKDKPLVTLNYNAQSNAQTEVTAVQFNYNDTELYTGTNRGIINVWDIEAQKLSYTLKGHTIGINALCIFPQEHQQNILMSGSFDTNVKVWDLRQKNQVFMLKGHTMQVNCLAGSPDGKIVASGASDGQVRLWDTVMGKCAFTFSQHEASVTCLKFNPDDMAMASASADKTIKYYDLDTNQLISQSKPDATQIQQILFNEKGEVLFSAAQDSLKIWNLDNDCMLLDNVESQWRGIQDLTISDEDEALWGLTSYQQTFGFWACPLKLINIDPEKPISSFNQQRIKTGSQQQSQQQLFTQYQQQQQRQQQQFQQQPPPQQPQGFLPQIDIKNKPTIVDDSSNKYSKKHGTNQENSYQIGQNHALQRSLSEMHDAMHSESPYNLNNNNNNNKLNKYDPSLPQQQQYPNTGSNQAGILSQPPHIIQARVESLPNLPAINASAQNFYKPNNQNMISPTRNPLALANRLSQELNPRGIVQESQEKPSNQKTARQRDEIQSDIEEDLKVDSANNVPQLIVQQSKEQVQSAESQQQSLETSQLSLMDSMGVSFNHAVTDSKQQELLKQMEFVTEVQKEHSKFLLLMNNRVNYIKPIQYWWTQGNTKSSICAISQLVDPCYVMDALNVTCSMNKLQYLSIDRASVLLSKAKILIDSKYQSHIKFGFEFVTKILDQYKDEVINVKAFSQMSKMDLAREERMIKYDGFIEEVKNIQKISRIKKIADRKAAEEIGQLASQLLKDLAGLLARIDGFQNNNNNNNNNISNN